MSFWPRTRCNRDRSALPITVLHVITRLDWGGSAQNTVLTALGHDRTRFAPMVMMGSSDGSSAQGGGYATEQNCRRMTAHDVTWEVVPSLVRDIRPLTDLRALLELFRTFKRVSPTIVHTHTSKAGVLGRLAAWMAGVPVVIHTPHGHVFYGHFGPVKSWIFERIERLMAGRTTWMIALTQAERDEHLRRRVGEADHFTVVSSGIDVKAFQRARGAVREDFGQDRDIRIGSVGWLTPVKGHRYLIEAIRILMPTYGNVRCTIVGSGPLEQELTAYVACHGLTSQVSLLGYREDVSHCLAGFDLFVLPSLNEGMGRALIEAMAMGIPVVATRVGGVPAVVEDRKTGLLVPPGDPQALAEALEELIRNPSFARELGNRAREFIDDRFSVETMVRSIEQVYEAALREQGAAIP